MRRMRWIVYLWPGLPQLLSYGSWAGLAIALGMAIVLDTLLLISFGWCELIGNVTRNVLWIIVGIIWVLLSYLLAKQSRRYSTTAGETDDKEDLFSTAVEQYLRGDYYQTEQILQELLRRNIRDVDARLMLATLMRHTGRFDEALRQLDILARFDGAEKWELEMCQERKLLTEAKATAATAA